MSSKNFGETADQLPMQRKSRLHVYLPVGNSDFDWGLYLTVVGFNRVLSGESFPSANHPVAYQFDPNRGRVLAEYQLIFISKGKGVFSSEKTGTISLSEGSVFLLFPGEWHTYRPDPVVGWEDYWIGFNGSYVYELCRRKVFSPSSPVFYPPNSEKLVDYFEGIIRATQADPLGNSTHYGAKVLEILAYIRKKVEDAGDELHGKEKIVEEAARIVWGWSYRNLKVDDIAKRVGVQRRTLERYFRETRGNSLLEEIMRCRLTRARRLIENTRIPIGQIALMSGFSSTQQMRRNFRLTFGKTPEDLRRESH